MVEQLGLGGVPQARAREASAKKRVPFERANELAYRLMSEIRPHCTRIEIAGSLRRLRPTVGDVDLVLVPKVGVSEIREVVAQWATQGRARILRYGESIISFVAVRRDIQVDLNIATSAGFPLLLLIKTGSRQHNIKLCQVALARGMNLHVDGRGIEMPDGKLVQPRSEQEVFRLLGLPYRKPEERE